MRAFLWALALPALAKNYAVDGIVVAVDPIARTMLVSHRPIARYMPAMMMPFRVEDTAALSGVHAGSRVQFDLEVGRQHSVARNIRVTGETDVRVSDHRVAIGAALPDFRLTDQDGRQVTAADLRGKVTAVNFLYTRCPLPDVCPRLAANFAAIARRFGDRVALVSVTVDPDYDTPAVLKEYASHWKADPRTWRFLTGDAADLAAKLGEVYWFDEGSIGHNSMMSVFGRDGKLAAVVEGAGFRVDQLGDVIARQLEDER